MPLVDKKNCIPLLIFVTILPRSRLSSTPIVLTSIPCTNPVTFPTNGPVTPVEIIVPAFVILNPPASKFPPSAGVVSSDNSAISVLFASSTHTPP